MKEILKTETGYGWELVLYHFIATNTNNKEDVFGIYATTKEGDSKSVIEFNKKAAKAIIKAIAERLEELEKAEQRQTLTRDEIIEDLEKRIKSLELALRSLSSHPDIEINGDIYLRIIEDL